MKRGRSMNSCFKMEKMKIILALALVAGAAACSSHEPLSPPPDSSEMMMVVRLAPDGMSPDDSRSIIETGNVENLINDAVIAAYEQGSGVLSDVSYSDSGQALMLDTSKSYNVYVVANMGDISSDFPAHESGIGALKLSLPAFASLGVHGLPMAATTSTPWKAGLDVSLRRLVAKVNVTIDSSDMDSGGAQDCFSGTTVKVHRAARNLYPFRKGGSRAGDSEDLYEGVADFQSVDIDDPSESLTLYIPENMQGCLLEGNYDPWEKSESTESFDASLCTYISLEGVKDGSDDGVGGDFIYRFFPGEDATGNFDLQGNRIYDISLVLTWDGMYVTDNWKVEKTNWADNRRIYVSVSEDHGYASRVRMNVERGASDVPVYIYYTPHGHDYESEEDGGDMFHHTSGWMFMPMDSPYEDFSETFPRDNTSEFIGTYMSTGFVGHTGYRTVHYVSIPLTTNVGYSNTVVYMTMDGRCYAYLDIKVIEGELPGLSVEGLGDGSDHEIEY